MMSVAYRIAIAILIPHLWLAFAQQTCYWPDGSSPPQNAGYVNCYADQDSQCCVHGEVCLGNGLCYGSSYGWVGSVVDKSLIRKQEV